MIRENSKKHQRGRYISLFTAAGTAGIIVANIGIRSLGLWAILSFLPLYATDYLGLKPEISAWSVSLIWAYRLAAIPVFASFILFLVLHFLENKHDKAYKAKLNLVSDKG
jgi:predicted membrane protein